MLSRRVFVKDGALTLFGLGLVPGFLYRTARATVPGPRRKTLVTVFLRGGVDGLNVVVPFGEKPYYSGRPSIAIAAPGRAVTEAAIDLDGFFGLHPALSPLLPLYKSRRLAVIEAVGSPDSTRSHFQAQDFMETAIPGDKSADDGWLNRFLQRNPAQARSPFRGVSMGTALPLSLKGKAQAIALGRLDGFDLRAGRATNQVRSGYESLYSRESNALLSGTADDLFDAIDFLKKANPSQYRASAKARYPRGTLGSSLKELAQLLKSDVGIEVAFLDVGGWDTHVNQGGASGQLANLLRQLGQGLAAFHDDLGDRMDDTLVLTMSEFGRTVVENGNRGTDHGHANVMFLMGGPVKGGRIFGRWPGLSRERLYEQRDLALTTDFRTVFAELLTRHLGCSRSAEVFPGFDHDPKDYLGLV